MITKLDFNSDYKLSKDCNYALQGPLWAGKIQGLHTSQRTWTPACLSALACDVGTWRLGNDLTGQITYSYKRSQLKLYGCLSVTAMQSLFMQAYKLDGSRPHAVPSLQKSSLRKDAICLVAAGHHSYTLPHHAAPLQISLEDSPTLGESRKVPYILVERCICTQRKLLTPLHVSLCISGTKPQHSLISLSVHKAKYHPHKTKIHKRIPQCNSQQVRDKEAAAPGVNLRERREAWDVFKWQTIDFPLECRVQKNHL